MGILRIKDRVFEVRLAELGGILNGETRTNKGGGPELVLEPQWYCTWGVNVETAARVFTDPDDPRHPMKWQPRAYSEMLPLRAADWRDFDGLVIETDALPPEERDQMDAAFSLYVYEHEDIVHNRLYFSGRRDTRFNLVWDGLCNVYGGEEYDEKIPFHVETEIEFTGIRLAEMSLARAQEAIESLFGLGEFELKQQELLYENTPHSPQVSLYTFAPKL